MDEKREKMTPKKIAVLSHLLRHGPSTVAEVTRTCGTTSCRFLKELTTAGYVSKTLAADGRRIVHAVTAKVPEDLSMLLPLPSERKARVARAVVHVPTREQHGEYELSCELAWVVRDQERDVIGAYTDKTDALRVTAEHNAVDEDGEEPKTIVVVPRSTRMRPAKARANA